VKERKKEREREREREREKRKKEKLNRKKILGCAFSKSVSLVVELGDLI
jgi:hypothetical protein